MNKSVCNVEGCTKARHNKKTAKCHEHVKQANREWARTNRDKVLASVLRFRMNNEGQTYLDTSSGYVKYVGFNHPASSPCGVTRYHRIVLWDKLNGQDVPCADCGRQLYWSVNSVDDASGLTVDHINGIRNDNRPENLDAVCMGCNNERAAKARAARKEESV